MTDPDFEKDTNEEEIKSKTQLKNESLALQDLGKSLVELGQSALDKIPLDEELYDAIMLARRINRKKDGFRRQLQLIGKMLRNREVDGIEHALLELQNAHQKANKAFHKLESLRDDLIKSGDDAIQQVLAEHPQLDRQKIRQLVRQAVKQAETNKPPKASRELFKYLKVEIGE